MTNKQRIYFFRLFAKACERQSIPPAEREDYRHRLIAEAVPASRGSLTGIGTGVEVDRLMQVVAREAQCAEASQHFATSDARRVAKMCEALVWQIWQIDCGMPQSKVAGGREQVAGGLALAVKATVGGERLGAPTRSAGLPPDAPALPATCSLPPATCISPADYLRGIIAQAGWRWAVVAADDGWWLDLPLPHAQKLMMMLDTHRRRLIKRFEGRKRERLPNGRERSMRLAFDVGSAYRWRDGTLWREPLEAAPSPRVRVRVTA